MTEKNLLWKLLITAVLAVLAFVEAYPLEKKLKGGIDLVGGTSLLYEIDDSDVPTTEKAELAEQLMRVLRRRVDPEGVRNLVWRPIGGNRLEIQMPLTAGESTARRQAYRDAQDAIKAKNIHPNEVEQALASDARDAALAALQRGVSARDGLVASVIEAYDVMQSVPITDIQGKADADEKYETALDVLLATNIDVGELDAIVSLDKTGLRAERLDRFKAKYPDRAELIDQAATAHAEWAMLRSGLDDPADLQRLLRSAGVLEFRLLAEPDPQNPGQIETYRQQLAERGPRVSGGDQFAWFEIGKPASFLNVAEEQLEKETFDQIKGSLNLIADEFAGKYYALCTRSPNKGLLSTSDWKLESATPVPNPARGGYEVLFKLNERGGVLFERLSRENIKARLGILLDDQLMSAPVIQETIRTQGSISGDFTQSEVYELAQVLNAGALPARLKQTPIAVKTVGPSLGETNRKQGVNAAKWAALWVLIFMAIYYRRSGIIADVAVSLNILLVLGMMAMMDATFTLPGIAGLALTIGMAVDANVLINERIREELARGVSLRLAIKTGYEKAFSAILDSNVTTIMTCVILGYFGSEEVKGFALTLGLGLVCNVFTAVFVTRWLVMGLVEVGAIPRLRMMQLIGVPRIDWMGKRRGFQTVSVLLVIGGLVVFIGRGKDQLDIEFLGGVSAQIELKAGTELTDAEVRKDVTEYARDWLAETASPALASAEVAQPGAQAGVFTIQADGLTATQIESFVLVAVSERDKRSALGTRVRIEDIATDTIRLRADKAVTSRVDRGDGETVAQTAFEPMTVEEVKLLVNDQAAKYAVDAARRLATAAVQIVTEVGDQADESAGDTYEVITTETNKKIVRDAILAVMGDQLNIQGSVNFKVHTDAALAPDGLFPIEARRLASVINMPEAAGDLRDYRGGVAIVLDDLKPAQSIAQVTRRLRDMRLQPDFEQYEWREFEVFGLEPAGEVAGQPAFASVAIAVVDQNFPFDEDEVAWRQDLAGPELALTRAALLNERSLQKVTQFGSQVASQAANQALLAMVLALMAIVIYIWLRFGSLNHGLAAIAALVHDVSIALGAVAAGYYVSQSSIGQALGFIDFKIDLAMVAAFLTLVGYSLNDTIVVFDRIRENRGKVATITSPLINDSINQMLGRTLLTSTTTLIVVLVLYAAGGRGIHGISYALLVGTIVGTYSSIGVASPLLLRGKLAGKSS